MVSFQMDLKRFPRPHRGDPDSRSARHSSGLFPARQACSVHARPVSLSHSLHGTGARTHARTCVRACVRACAPYTNTHCRRSAGESDHCNCCEERRGSTRGPVLPPSLTIYFSCTCDPGINFLTRSLRKRVAGLHPGAMFVWAA